MFASEKDETTRELYMANHPETEKMFESCSLKERDLKDTPSTDSRFAIKWLPFFWRVDLDSSSHGHSCTSWAQYILNFPLQKL